MAKKVLAVVLDGTQGSNAAIEKRLRKEYANVHRYTETFFLVPVDPAVGPAQVAATAGIKGPGRDATGVVFKLNAAYAGFTHKTLWEWLSDVEGS